MKSLYILPLYLFLSTKAHASSNIEKLNFFLEANLNAESICDDQARDRENLSQDAINTLKSMEPDHRRSYLIYKSEISMHKCIMKNGGYPDSVIEGLFYASDSNYSLKKLIRAYRELRAQPTILESMYVYKDIPAEQKNFLNKTTYFDKPFKPIKVAEQLK